jgi:hypothetical protein
MTTSGDQNPTRLRRGLIRAWLAASAITVALSATIINTDFENYYYENHTFKVDASGISRLNQPKYNYQGCTAAGDPKGWYHFYKGPLAAICMRPDPAWNAHHKARQAIIKFYDHAASDVIWRKRGSTEDSFIDWYSDYASSRFLARPGKLPTLLAAPRDHADPCPESELGRIDVGGAKLQFVAVKAEHGTTFCVDPAVYLGVLAANIEQEVVQRYKLSTFSKQLSRAGGILGYSIATLLVWGLAFGLLYWVIRGFAK